MANKPNEFGRTFFDLISEHPKITLSLFILIIALLGCLLYKGNSVKVAGLEVTPPIKDIPKDTVVKIVRETIIEEKPKIITKYIERPKQSTKVKKGDIEVEVSNQPTNVNFGDNSVVGNNINSTITINPKEKFSKEEKENILKELKIQKGCIAISANRVNPESYEMRKDLISYLNEHSIQVARENPHIDSGGLKKRFMYYNSQGGCRVFLITSM